jgi:putative transposase
VLDPVNALEDVQRDVTVDVSLFPSQLPTVEVLRRPLESTQYTSDAFQDELFFLGIESSPAFVRAPEGNGCAERLIRTLKEQLLWLRPFQNVEELRLALLAWAARYNSSWLIERHGFLTPAQARTNYEEATKAA